MDKRRLDVIEEHRRGRLDWWRSSGLPDPEDVPLALAMIEGMTPRRLVRNYPRLRQTLAALEAAGLLPPEKEEG